MQTKKTVRIGGASGFWGDSAGAAPQLVQNNEVDYVVFDYLAELTMSILSAARLKNPQLGYATDFVTSAMKSILPQVASGQVKVVSNAGGMNPKACAQALHELASSLGYQLQIQVVLGDDLLSQVPEMVTQNVQELQSGQALPAKLLSANAYLGALPIAKALDSGAQVVITGRCVDSAVTLGVLIHEFQWQAHDYDLLAQGSLAGHLIECGAQATGGLFTDWETVPDWANIAYPIIECDADGSFMVSKPQNTGGLVSVATLSEQLVYEIGDPAHYLLPDVIADFTQVRMLQAGPHRVRVQGASGRAPTDFYKVSATYLDGYKCSGQLTIVGMNAYEKAKRTGQAILERTRNMLTQNNWPDYSATHLEVLGAESAYGNLAHPAVFASRELVLRLTVTHIKKEALDLFAKEIAPAGTSFAPGTTGAGGGRPAVSPRIKQFAFLWPKNKVAVSLWDINTDCATSVMAYAEAQKPILEKPSFGLAIQSEIPVGDRFIEGPLIQWAYARSGDKGNISNIGVIARKAEYLPYIKSALSTEAVKNYLSFSVKGNVTRYDLPGIDAINFVCEQALDGGGMASLRNDALGKGMAQILLSMPIRMPKGIG